MKDHIRLIKNPLALSVAAAIACGAGVGNVAFAQQAQAQAESRAPGVDEVTVTGSRIRRDDFGNPSSVHHFGQRAKAVIDEARSAVASLIGAEPGDITFTGSGTESDNIAVRGTAEALEISGRRHLVASSIEHEAVLNTLKALAKRGWTTTLVPVGESGVARDGCSDSSAWSSRRSASYSASLTTGASSS